MTHSRPSARLLNRLVLVFVLVLVLPATSVALGDGAVRLHTANGLSLTVYSSDLLAERLTYRDGEPVIPLDDGRYFPVITDINDPSIYNKGDGEFHPFPDDMVIDALETISHPNMALEVVVYILPYPRRGVLASSTSDNEVFLSPHVLDIHPTVGGYIIAHEIGHVFHNLYLPSQSSLWVRYRRVRGIEDAQKFSNAAAHAYRPCEIFAEDFRVLYGGDLAAFGGRIENPELPTPTTVAGLEMFLSSIGGTPVATEPKVVATSYPNPFNPETEIRIKLPEQIVSAGNRVTVRVYDVTGALVRDLYSDAPGGERLHVQWDGRDRNGNSAASGNYFAVIDAGQARATLKLVLIK